MGKKNPGLTGNLPRPFQHFNKSLIFFLLIWVILEELLISQFSFPGAVRYLTDLALLWLMLCCLVDLKALWSQFRHTGYLLTLLSALAFVAYLLLGACLNRVAPLLALWGLRNTCRALAFFVVCVYTLDRNDLDRLLKLLRDLQWLNLAMCLFQYFILGKYQDYLGGMFGTDIGCNIYLNLYLCFLFVFVIVQYLHQQCSLGYLSFTLVSGMVISCLAELKIAYVELICIVIAAIILFPRRKGLLKMILAAAAALAIGLYLLWLVYPIQFRHLSSAEEFLAYGISQEGGYGLSRFRAYQLIDQLFFQGDLFHNLFGYGVGSCEYSRFAFLTSDFYRANGHYHYIWFTHQTLFLETGWLGTLLYLLTLAIIALTAWRRLLKCPDTSFYAGLTVTMCGIALISFVYNATIREEAGYLLFFAMASDAIAGKCASSPKNTEDQIL